MQGELPVFFGEFYTYITSLQPTDTINYTYLQQLIQQAPSTSKPWFSRKRPAEDLQPAAAAAEEGASQPQPSHHCQQPDHGVPEQMEVHAPASKRIKAAELEQEAGTTGASCTPPLQLVEAVEGLAAAEQLQVPDQQQQAAPQIDAAAEVLPHAAAADVLPDKAEQQQQEVPMCEE
jgi:hypothetical protein